MEPKRILLIQLRKIGDCLLTTPAVRAIKNRFKNARVVFLTEAPANEIFEENPYVDEVLVYNRRWNLLEYISFILRLRRMKFDLVIDFFSNPRSALITLLTGAKTKVGWNFRVRSFVYNVKVSLSGDKNRYSCLDKLDLLKPLGIYEEDCRLEFFCKDEEPKRANGFIIGLCAVASMEYNRWPAERFGFIADSLIEKYRAKIVLLYGPGEESYALEVKEKMRFKESVFDCQVFSLKKARAVIKGFNLYIGCDNGLKHIATSCDIPTVIVFGKTNPYNWTPPNNRLHRFIEYDPGCKEKCNVKKCKDYLCIKGVDKTRYLEIIEKTINELNLLHRNHL
ncbi:MAG: glycosyltransferase family 9 protein [bacterium]